MTVKKIDSESSNIYREIEHIKRLLILGLMRSGASQAEIANALGVNQSSISRMFPHAVTTKVGTK
jgi:predicted XRE-type DNA-binding protein